MHIDEFRDPRMSPMRGDKVKVDLGDGDTETRTVRGIKRSGEPWVEFTLDGDAAVHTMRVRHWREYANDSVVLDRGLPA